LRSSQIDFKVHTYKYHEKEVALSAARELGVDEHQVIKTLVFEDDQKRPLLVMMHGDKQVSTKTLARQLGAKSVTPCDQKTAEKHTGYMVGGISPFGTRKRLATYVEESIMELPKIYVNGGRRGVMVEITPPDLERVMEPILVRVAR